MTSVEEVVGILRERSNHVWWVAGLCVVLALLIVMFSLVVRVDFRACFDDFAASFAAAINWGTAPFERVRQMPVSELLSAMLRKADRDSLLLLGLSLLPLLPFLLATALAKTRATKRFWTVSAAISALAILALLGASGDMHDCDRNGVSIGLALAPIIAFIGNVLAIPVLLAARWWFGSSDGET